MLIHYLREDNDQRAVYCIPPRPRFVDSEAVRQSIHERGDVCPSARDYADLPQRNEFTVSTSFGAARAVEFIREIALQRSEQERPELPFEPVNARKRPMLQQVQEKTLYQVLGARRRNPSEPNLLRALGVVVSSAHRRLFTGTLA